MGLYKTNVTFLPNFLCKLQALFCVQANCIRKSRRTLLYFGGNWIKVAKIRSWYLIGNVCSVDLAYICYLNTSFTTNKTPTLKIAYPVFTLFITYVLQDGVEKCDVCFQSFGWDRSAGRIFFEMIFLQEGYYNVQVYYHNILIQNGDFTCIVLNGKHVRLNYKLIRSKGSKESIKMCVELPIFAPLQLFQWRREGKLPCFSKFHGFEGRISTMKITESASQKILSPWWESGIGHIVETFHCWAW